MLPDLGESVTALQTNSHYDLITAFDAIHDQIRPDKVLEGIATTLKGSRKNNLPFSHPIFRPLAGAWHTKFARHELLDTGIKLL